jgi:hypothetical protein
MNGNSNNKHSNNTIQPNSSRQHKQYGPTIRNFHFSFMTTHFFSHNSNSMNHTFKKNSSKVIFAIAIIIFLVQFDGSKNRRIKIKTK